MKVLLQITAVILVVLTLCICTVKPDMHKSFVIYNFAYKLVPEEVAVVEKEDIPIMEIPVKPKETTVKVEKKTEPIKNTVKTEKKVNTVSNTKPKEVKTVQKTKPEVVKKEVVSQQTEKKPVQTVVNTVKTEKPATVVKTEPVKQEQPKVLTQQEEEIAWNIWRSNLQNKIMQDVYMPTIPEGTVFKFSFTVDKYGRVSNVQTYSSTPSYTPYAIQYIAPVIRSYQGKSLLNFPQGSSRISTEVKGGWKISTNEKYSTPSDYNDIEKIKK